MKVRILIICIIAFFIPCNTGAWNWNPFKSGESVKVEKKIEEKAAKKTRFHMMVKPIKGKRIERELAVPSGLRKPRNCKEFYTLINKKEKDKKEKGKIK
jgi:hypothetical protein